MRLGKLALAAVGVLVVLAIALVSAGYWLIASEAGTGWLLARLESRIPLRVSIGDLSGTLLRGFELRNVVIEIGNDRLEIDAASLELDLAGALERTVTVTRLSVSTATYYRGAPADGARARFNVPIPVRVVTGSLRRFVLVRDDRATEIGPASLAASVLGNRIEADEIVAEALGFDLRGSGGLSIDTDITINADFSWSTMYGDLSYSGSGQASGAWPELAFRQNIDLPVTASADGSVLLGADPSAQVDLSWRELAWPGFAFARSPEGTARLSGWLDAYDFAADGRLVVEGIETDVTASGSGTPQRMDFTALHFSGEPGEIDAIGQLAFAPATWDFDIETRALNPAVRLPDWSGALDIRGELAGTTSPRLELSLSNMSASGELRAQPIVATGNVAYRAPNLWQLDGFVVTIEENQVALTGSLGETVALDVAIDARNLERLTANAAGVLRATGHVAGTLAEPTLTGELTGEGLRYAEFSAQTLALDGEVVADQSRAVRLNLGASGLVLRGRSIDSAAAAVTGTAARHVATLELAADDANAELRATGSWLDGLWRGELTALELDEPTIGAWALTDVARVELGRDRLDLQRTCLTQRETTLCGLIRIGTDADLLDIELDALDLAMLAPFLPSELAVTGRYDASLHLTGPLQRPTGTFAASGTGTLLSIREVDEPALEVAIESIGIEGDITDAGELNLVAGLQGRAGAEVAVDATVTRIWDADRQLTADISGQWEDLGMLSLLSPNVGDVSGTASIDVTLEGSPRSPAVRGRAHWSNGRVAVPRWGLVVEDIDAAVSSPDGTRLLLQASGLAGEGRIDVTGVTEVDAQNGWPTELRVYGDRLQAVRLPDAQILVSPALEVRAALPDIEVSGAFLIPYARLELEALPPQAVRPSPDTVVHGVDRPPEEHPLNLHADIRVGLGEDVRYTGAGLDVALSGAMGLVYNSGRPAVASGSVTLTGQYQAYGQNLDIDEGQLLFAGPVANPTLDVRAVRRIEPGTTDIRLTETTIVGVELSGTVEAPVARVFSEPVMNEADALSYLLLGRPLSASGDEETATLESAAFAMGLQQALPVIQRFGESLGFDEFSVQTTSADTGELMAGKRLGPRLYVRYTYGLFNRIGGLLMRFDLSERYSLETRSGDNRSMDLIYTVERD